MIFVSLVGIWKLMNKEEETKRKLVVSHITYTHTLRLAPFCKPRGESGYVQIN